jgi:hypothetical protein
MVLLRVTAEYTTARPVLSSDISSKWKYLSQVDWVSSKRKKEKNVKKEKERDLCATAVRVAAW